ncbi:hypothetical protein F0344_22190 [Streptomyces finlayi]|uniref:Uncharacterized protein n=1 Tax=Streptomyces finlayi TaxID=67296 RepID=A0A7G7BNQ0_9ACTN|nr:hypothetical protein [Streptomyces finlayi]QNE76965.1 hypothetical protein F0344_22190 [Streptomyces finlayi]
MSQPPPYNPYSQPPAMPPSPPGFGAPQQPYAGQPPMQSWQQPPMPPGQPYPQQPMPFGQREQRGHPVGAFFLGYFASVVVSLAYSVLVLATYEDQTRNTPQILYIAHALLNGAIVGTLIGLMARRRSGAWISGAVIAPLGVFFGHTNAVPMIIADISGMAAVGDMMEDDPFIPAKVWWGSHGDTEWISLLGLVLAAAMAWLLAFATGRRR